MKLSKNKKSNTGKINSATLLYLEDRLNKELYESTINFYNNGLVTEDLENKFTMNGKKNDFGLNYLDFDMSISMLRYDFVEKYGFVLLNEKLIKSVSKHLNNKKIIELGAGTGWLSHQLQKNNIDITPIDKKIKNNDYGFNTTYTDILECDAIEYLKKNNNYDTVILSWPNYSEDFAYEVLKNIPKGKELIYIGEREGGCTANDDFFNLLADKTILNKDITNQINKNSLSWKGIHDKWYVYQTTE